MNTYKKIILDELENASIGYYNAGEGMNKVIEKADWERCADAIAKKICSNLITDFCQSEECSQIQSDKIEFKQGVENYIKSIGL